MATKKMESIPVDLLAEIKRLAAMKQWEIEGWKATDNAIVIVRTILKIAGDKELLADTPEMKAERQALCDAILSPLESGAAVNFERDALIPLGISPRKMGKGEKTVDRLAGA